jgi:Pvc16 N-terminal domain
LSLSQALGRNVILQEGGGPVANYQAVFAVGDAIAKYLNNNYDATVVGFPCTFQLVSSVQIASDTTTLNQTVSIFLHRMTTNDQFRYVTRLQDAPDEQPILHLDLHYLLSYWDDSAQSAEAEQKILVWTMQQLQSNPILDTSILALSLTAADWDKNDAVQIIPADLSLQDILDIWDGLGPKYRLTVGYVARVVHIDQTITPGLPVVATRFTLQPNGGAS